MEAESVFDVVDSEGSIARAKDEGLVCSTPKDNELQIDIDDAAGYSRFVRSYATVKNIGSAEEGGGSE